MAENGSEIASEYLQPNIGGDISLFKGIAKILIEATLIKLLLKIIL